MASGASLTKEQLKEQLIAHGIEAPPAKAPKASFVKLYDIHIASGHGQFSSDDEVKVKSSSGRKSKKLAGFSSKFSVMREVIQEEAVNTEQTKVQAYVVPEKGDGLQQEQSAARSPSFFTCGYGSSSAVDGREFRAKKISSTSMKSDESSQLSDLSNSQLAAKLKQFGVGVGPIGPTTRHVYVKKLTKLLYQESASESPTKEEYSDEDTKEEEIPSVPVTRSSSRRRTMHLSENIPQVSTRRSASGTNKRRSVAVSTVRETETFYSPEASERCFSTSDLSTYSSTPERPLPYCKPTKNISARYDAAQVARPLPRADSSALLSATGLSSSDNFGLAPSLMNISLVEFPKTTLCTPKPVMLRKVSESDDDILVVAPNQTKATNQRKPTPTKLINSSAGHIRRVKATSHIFRSESAKPAVLSYPISPLSQSRGFLHSTPRSQTFTPTASRHHQKRSYTICNSVTRRRPLRPGASQTKTPIKPAQQTEQQENKTEEDATKSTSEQQDENRLFPLWVQVLIPLAFLVFFYLVFQAMESNPNKLELH